jgi:hypothetical protein
MEQSVNGTLSNFVQLTWTGLTVLILSFAVVNSLSILQMDDRVKALEDLNSNTKQNKSSPLSVLSYNWDLVVLAVVLSALAGGLALPEVQGLVVAKPWSSGGAISLTVIAAGSLVAIKRG